MVLEVPLDGGAPTLRLWHDLGQGWLLGDYARSEAGSLEAGRPGLSEHRFAASGYLPSPLAAGPL